MRLSELHDCKKCHNKIVCISVDKLGISRCGYCNEIVDYAKCDEFKDSIEETKNAGCDKN